MGGAIADRFGGARVTFVTFIGMAMGAGCVLFASRLHSLGAFLFGFTVLFALSGIGNGSTYKMIPAIFRTRAALACGPDAVDHDAEADGRRLAGALLGLAGAIGAFGGVLVNIAFRESFLSYHTGDGAYLAFITFHAVCVVVTWAVYLRPSTHRLVGV